MGRNRKNNQYFGENEEKAVQDYIKSDSAEEKDYIYNTYLAEPFRIMKESILRRYSTHIGNYDIHEVESNALTHLLEQMVKFNPNAKTRSGQKTRAYSYCQTIIRNYYIDHSKKSYLEKKINLNIDGYLESLEENSEYIYEIDKEEKTSSDFLKDIINKIEIEIIENTLLTIQEVLVGDAIINILKNWEILFLEDSGDGDMLKKTSNKFSKNKIFLLIKEQTGLESKDIRLALKSLKNVYFLSKDDFFSEQDI